MNKALIMSAASVALFSASAQAQTARQTHQTQPYQSQEQQVRADKKSNIEITPYFGIRGIASFQKATWGEDKEHFENGGFETAVGTKITDNFRAEFAYAWRGGSKKTEKDVDGKASVEPTVQSYMINGYVDLPTDAEIRPYLGVGIGLGKTKYDMSYTDYTDPEFSGKLHPSKTKFAYSLSAGLTYEATKALSWDLGYRFADFGSFSFDGDKFKTKAHEIVFGARFAFR